MKEEILGGERKERVKRRSARARRDVGVALGRKTEPLHALRAEGEKYLNHSGEVSERGRKR